MGPFGEFENLSNVQSQGLEGNVKLDWNDALLFNSNVTYQNITDQTKFDEGIKNTNYESRIPNVPYLFGNVRLGVNAAKKKKVNKLIFYWSLRYVHDFYLTWANLGNTQSKKIIPAQTTQDLQASYSFNKEQCNLSFTIANFTNALVYDNFNIQKPGRSFHVKLRYFLTK